MAFLSDNYIVRLRSLNNESLSRFALIIAKRLLPNYEAFNNSVSFSDAHALENIIDNLEQIIVKKNAHSAKKFREIVSDLMPDTEDYSGILVSSALDCSSVVSELNEFLEDKSIDRILSISTLAFDTVDMFSEIYEDNTGSDLNGRLINNEVQFQKKLIDELCAKSDVLEMYDKIQGSLSEYL